MFKQLFDLFRKESLLKQAYNRSLEMIREDREMFVAAMQSLREHDGARIDIDIYAKDQMINAYEREVRRNVLTHLTIAQGQNAHAGLALVSIVVDIERIGDYTKNIVALALQHPGRLKCGSFDVEVRKMETTVQTMFNLMLEALPGGDAAKAREIMSEHWWIAKRSDAIIDQLVAKGDESLTVSDAVSTALYIRYLKRISAHLMNIASSVVNPFDRIGFRPEDDVDERH